MTRPALLCSLLSSDSSAVLALGQELHRARLDVRAHRWDSTETTLAGVLTALAAPDCVMWCVAGPARAFEDARTRRMLTLAALGAQAARGRDFPIMLLPAGGRPMRLPEPLADAGIADKGAAGKILARLHSAPALPARPWRLNVHCPQGMGIWLEIGPAAGAWHGALCGLLGADSLGAQVRPLAHMVGPAGGLPAQSTLECPLNNIPLPTAQGVFAAWGAGNTLTPDCSYYVQVSAPPQMLLFGPLPRHGEAELTALHLETGDAAPAAAPEKSAGRQGKAFLQERLTYRHKKCGAPAAGSQRS